MGRHAHRFLSVPGFRPLPAALPRACHQPSRHRVQSPRRRPPRGSRPQAAPVNPAPLLSVRDLTVEFSTHGRLVRAVSQASLDVAPGESAGLVGESGSGKTVTGLAVMGLLPRPSGRITAGQITVDGTELTQLPERSLRLLRGRTLAMVPQDPMTSLNPVLTIREQLTETLLAHEQISNADARRRAVELLRAVGIAAA